MTDGTISDCPTDVGGWAIRVPFSTLWSYGHNAVIACQTGHYTGAFDAESSGVKYGPGGTSSITSGIANVPKDSPFLPNNFAVSGGFRSGVATPTFNIDPFAYEFAFNQHKYSKVAKQCCKHLLVTGSSVDGVYIKNDTIINGRTVYVSRHKGSGFSS